MTRLRGVLLALSMASTLGGCASEVDSEDLDATASEPRRNEKRDILATALDVDLGNNRASATINVAPSDRSGATFEVGDLKIDSVTIAGKPVRFRLANGRLDLGLAAKKSANVRIDYRFERHDKLQGVSKSGTSFMWPYFCGNVFPCKSDPSDGVRFELTLRGVPSGMQAIFPRSIGADAPSYMLAWAVGEYTKIDLGTTSLGRKVSVHYLPGEKSTAIAGTQHLAQHFDWLEKTYGAYLFGSEVGSVSANWGSGAFGGMEHHPFWHVSHGSMGDAETHAHEAAHGWFGDGVRIACWEDLTLSEGTVSYLTARAIEAVDGAAAGKKVWANYESRLDDVIKREDRLALPDKTCGGIDVLKDLWNEVPYMKGAFFYRAVEEKVGRAKLDQAIATFYGKYKGRAARMQDMLDTIAKTTGFDPTALAKGWLRSLGRPDA
jgi:aminopeptidase N